MNIKKELSLLSPGYQALLIKPYGSFATTRKQSRLED
jgi:hypothetical protein